MQALVFSSNLTPHLEEESDETIELTSSLIQGEVNINSSISNSNSDSLIEISQKTQLETEILVYCQNFNRMKSAAKIREIHNKIASCSFSIILANETSWDESVRDEEVFGNIYNVFRDDRNLQTSGKKSGGGVLIAVSAKFNSEAITTSKFKEFEHVWARVSIAGETHVFASVYFPPLASKDAYEKFLHVADEIISGLPPEVKVHVYGDFNQRNIDFIVDIENESILLPVVGENETLQMIFDKTANMGLNQINHVKNRQNCYLDFLFTNTFEDFSVTESLSPLWKNEAFHTAIEFSIFIHEDIRPDDYEYEKVLQYNYLI